MFTSLFYLCQAIYYYCDMLRGQRNYSTLFPDETPPEVLSIPERKGRSEFLLLKRNELLIARYYYYYKIDPHQYPAILKLLSSELFLTERTIQDLLQKNQDMLKHFYTCRPNVKIFKNKFPHFVW